jgi:hypothetical protein
VKSSKARPLKPLAQTDPAASAPALKTQEDPALDRLRGRLLAKADLAIDALTDVASSADKDSARVAAASAILDRIGLVKPREQSEPSDLTPAVLAGALAGLGALTGLRINQDTLERIAKRAAVEQVPERVVGPSEPLAPMPEEDQKGEP